MFASYPGSLGWLGCGLGVCRPMLAVEGFRAALAPGEVPGFCPDFLLPESSSWRDLVQWDRRKFAPFQNIQGRVIERQIAVKRLVDYSPKATAGG